MQMVLLNFQTCRVRANRCHQPQRFPRLPRSQDHWPHTRTACMWSCVPSMARSLGGRAHLLTFSSSAWHSQCSGPQQLWTSYSTFPMTEVGHCCQLSPTQPLLLRLPITGRKRTSQSPSASQPSEALNPQSPSARQPSEPLSPSILRTPQPLLTKALGESH